MIDLQSGMFMGMQQPRHGVLAPQIVAHHNRVLGGGFVELAAASEIDF